MTKPSQARMPPAIYAALAILALLALATPMTPAASWTFNPYFKGAFNVVVNNWNYTQNGNPGIHIPAGYVLLTLNGTGNPYLMDTVGYSASQANLGYVPYWVVAQQSNTVVLLLANHTNETCGPALCKWNFSTIFYNPAANYATPPISSLGCINSGYITYPTQSIPGSAQNIFYGLNCTGNYYSFNGEQFLLFGPLINTLKPYNVTPQKCLADLSPTCNQYNATLAFYFNYPNDIPSYLQNDSAIGATPGTGYSFVMVSNQSMVSATRYFNITWNPYSSIPTGLRFRVASNSINNGYILTTCSLGNCGYKTFYGSDAFVFNQPVFSGVSNMITFGQTGYGYEGWFGMNFNGIATEGMSESETFLENATEPVVVRNAYGNPAQYFNLTVDTKQPTVFYLLPTFTTNIVKPVSVPNPTNAINPLPACQVNVTVWQCFEWRYNVTNIKWQYNFSSLATGNSLIPRVWFNFSSSNVHFAVIKVPYYTTLYMGPNCDDIMIEDAVTNDTIPYYVLNCTGNPATILLPDRTEAGYVYNSINMYYYSGLFSSPTTSNSSVYSNWVFQSASFGSVSNSFGVSVVDEPFIINTTKILTPIPASKVSTSEPSYPCNYDFEFASTGTVNYVSTFSCLGTLYTIYDPTNYPTTGWLVFFRSYGVSIVSHTLGLYNGVQANSTAANVMNLVFGTGGAGMGIKFNYNNATFRYLATTTYTNGSNSQNPSLPCNPNIAGSPCYKPIYPQYTTSIPHTTTNGTSIYNGPNINFNGITASMVALGDTGISIPLVALEGIEILLILIAFACVEEEYSMAAVAILVIMWIMGIFVGTQGKFQLLLIAVLATIFVLIEHTILENRRHRGRGDSGSGSGSGMRTAYNPRKNPPVKTISGGSL